MEGKQIMVFRSKLIYALLVMLAAFLPCTAIRRAASNEEKKKMVINRSTPVLHVKVVEPSLKFWTERFGFKTTIQVLERDHIGFAAIDNGSVELMYQTYEGMQANPSDPLTKAAEQRPTFILMEVPDIHAI